MGKPLFYTSGLLPPPSHIHAHGHIVLDGYREERRRVDLEIGDLRRNGSGEPYRGSLGRLLEFDLLILNGLAGELNLQIGMDGARPNRRVGHSRAHADEGELPAARHLQHVKIAVAVPRVEGLHRRRDQEIALSGLANAFASRRMADSLAFV